MNILLAEDSAESQDIMRLYLRDSPHHLECARTGTRVVEQFKKGSYDLVFMDLQMPEMDGYTATLLIRAWEAAQGRPRTPIIALTANGLREARIESSASGCDDFLTKPIKMADLIEAIERYAGTDDETRRTVGRRAVEESEAAFTAEVERLKPNFLQNRHRDLAELRLALSANNFEQIKIIGHRIKGLAGSFGLHEMGAVGGAIEQAALDKDVRLATQYIVQLAETLRLAEQTGEGESNAKPKAA